MWRIMTREGDNEPQVFADNYDNFKEAHELSKSSPFAFVEEYEGGIQVDFDAEMMTGKELDK